MATIRTGIWSIGGQRGHPGFDEWNGSYVGVKLPFKSYDVLQTAKNLKYTQYYIIGRKVAKKGNDWYCKKN